MNLRFTLAKLRTIFASILLVSLIMFAAVKITARSIRKQQLQYPLNTVERAFYYFAVSLDWNPIRVISKATQPGMVAGYTLQDVPQGKYIHIPDSKVSIPIKILYHHYDEKADAVIITLRNLYTNRTEHTIQIPIVQFQNIYSDCVEQSTEGNTGVQRDENPIRISNFEHPLLLKDGSVVVRVSRRGPISRMSAEGEILWKSCRISHHALELGPEGNLWTCGDLTTQYAEEEDEFIYESVLQLDVETGEVLWEKTLDEIFQANPKHDLSLINRNTYDPYHINDVQPALEDGRFWKKGDLFLSLRNINTVLLYRPSSNKILWSNSTYWAYQHDVNILNDTAISVFNNNTFESTRGYQAVDSLSEFVVYDFVKDSAYLPHKEVFQRTNFYSQTEGRSEWFVQDSVLFLEHSNIDQLIIHDFKADTAYRFVLEAPYEGKVHFLTWVRPYPLSYFESSQ